VDYETLAKLENEVREMRADLKRLREFGHDTAEDEALLIEIELLLLATREGMSSRGPRSR
jgi:hypothetical protein